MHGASVTIILSPFTWFHNVNNLLGNSWHLLIEDDSISSTKPPQTLSLPWPRFLLCEWLAIVYCMCVGANMHTHRFFPIGFFMGITCFNSRSNSYFVGSHYWQVLPAWDGAFPERSPSTAVWEVWTLMLICALLVAFKLLHGSIYWCSNNVLWSPGKQGSRFLSFFSWARSLIHFVNIKFKESHYAKQLVWTRAPDPGWVSSLPLLRCGAGQRCGKHGQVSVFLATLPFFASCAFMFKAPTLDLISPRGSRLSKRSFLGKSQALLL